MSKQTTSRVLMSGNTSEPERIMLRRWAEWAANHGGSFSITQEWRESNWYSIFVINWPDRVEGQAERGGGE